MSEPSLAKYRYRVDADDLLVWVDSWWLAFARENGAADLTADRVLGRSLWEFIADAGTRELYKEIHSRIRATGRASLLPFRCDSPKVCRHMRLTISQDGDGQLLYESVLLRVEPRRDFRFLDRDCPRSDAFLTMCSCCKRSLIESAGWLEVEEVAVRLGLFERPRGPQLRHTICPSCALAAGNLPGNDNAA
jgi:hypothetical protein